MHGAIVSLVGRSVQLMKRVQMEPEFTLIGGILRFETMVRVVREARAQGATSTCPRATWCSSCRHSAPRCSAAAADCVWRKMPPDDRPTPRRPEPASASRGIFEADNIADPAMLAEGWESRFVAQGPRLEEMTRLYRSLGYEVREVPLSPKMLGEECTDCRLVALLQFKLIYTRRADRDRSPGTTR